MSALRSPAPVAVLVTSCHRTRQVLLAGLLGLACQVTWSQIAVIALENKVALENGVSQVLANPKPDGAAILDLGVSPPRLIAQVELPSATVLGPPTTVAVTPNGAMALVGGGQKHDPADKSKLVNHDIVSLIDLQTSPPKLLGTVSVGQQPTGIAVNPAGTLALVANRGDGTVSVLKLGPGQASLIGSVALGKADSGPSGIVFTPDGKNALVTRDGDSFISVLAIDGDKVEAAKRDISIGTRPYGITMAPHGKWAAVANIGRGTGDTDTVSIIDLSRQPFRAVETFSVGQTPEGVMASPDGLHLAVVVMNGSNKAKSNAFYNDAGQLQIWRLGANADVTPIKVAQAAIGHWSQGALFSKDGKTVVAMNMVEKELQVFSFNGFALKETGRIKLDGGPAAGRIAGVN